MLSHTWEYDETLFQRVEATSVYDLQPSPANYALQNLCALARSLGFQWAWSDGCCVDQLSNAVSQESLVATFTWYRGSSLTVVHLRGYFRNYSVLHRRLETLSRLDFGQSQRIAYHYL